MPLEGVKIGVAGVVLACSSGRTPPSAVPGPPRVSSPSVAPLPAPSSAVAASRPPAPIVTEAPAALTDGPQREAFRVLAPLCEATVGRDAAGTLRAGCTCCAPFEECPPQPGVVPAVTGATALVRSVAFGSFTRPAVEEAALSMDGCESHAENYGGTVLAEQASGVWRMVRYDSGAHPDRMLAYRMRDGRDLVVSEWADAHQTWADLISVSDLANPSAASTSLFEVHDDTTMACIDKRTAVWGTIDAWELEDVDRDGVLELVIQARAGGARYSGAFAQRCAALIASMDQERPGVSFADVVSATKLELVFRFDGKRFVPTPATERQLRRARLR